MNEQELKTAIQYYKLGRENERQIILSILNAIGFREIDFLMKIRNAMDGPSAKEG